MASRVSQLLAVLIAAVLLAACNGMGVRYAQNYATYTSTMDRCSGSPTKITVPGPDGQTTTIEQANPACNNIHPPEHELKYVGPIISQGIASGVNAAVTVYQTERTTSSNERIAQMNADARTEEARYQNETLQAAFGVAGPHIEGSGNAVSSGGDATGAAPAPATPEMPEELTEGL